MSFRRPLGARLFAVALVAVVCGATLSDVATAGQSPPTNGIASKSADAIVAGALAAANSARSVHISGKGLTNGQPLVLDIRASARGGGGHITVNGLSFEVVRIGARAYFKGGVAFWRKAGGPAAAPLAPLFAGKWMMASATKGDLASLTPLTDLHSLLEAILNNHGTLVKGGTAALGGRQVVAVTDTQKGGTLYVAATGQPYPVEIEKGGSSGGTIKFDQWGAPLALTAPKGAVDINRYLKH
jgi:hypothetical protein